jgi:DNA-binding transcriptional ArsR family regulator
MERPPTGGLSLSCGGRFQGPATPSRSPVLTRFLRRRRCRGRELIGPTAASPRSEKGSARRYPTANEENLASPFLLIDAQPLERIVLEPVQPWSSRYQPGHAFSEVARNLFRQLRAARRAMNPSYEVLFEVLAVRTRRVIFECLCDDGEQTIRPLVDRTSVSRQAVQKHLRILIRAGLVEDRPRDRYSARRGGIAPLIAWANAYGSFSQVARETSGSNQSEESAGQSYTFNGVRS